MTPSTSSIASHTAPSCSPTSGRLARDHVHIPSNAEDCVHDDPLAWAALVLEAKGNNPDGVVLLGLLDDAALPEPRYCGTQGGQGEARLNAFMGYFEHTMAASVCMPDYGAFFEETAGMILDLCEPLRPMKARPNVHITGLH